MTDPHDRRCFQCGHIQHCIDRVISEVTCRSCGSNDTRAITLKPCPFCGAAGVLQKTANSTLGDYFSVGCCGVKCFGNVNEKGMAFPMDQVRGEVSRWNTRAEK